MSKQDELNSYIARLRCRLQLGTWLRGTAVFVGTALIVTVALVLLLNHFAFPAHGVTGARLALLAALAAAATFGIALPLVRLTRARAVHEAESVHPKFEERLTTFQERENNSGDPFLELLAADTLAHAQHVAPSSLIPDNRLFALGGAGLACLAVLIWTIAAGPGYLGYGASLLWTGPKKNAIPYYSIVVTPGDALVRRNSDQLITAHVIGMRPEKLQIFAHYQSASMWEPATMQAQPDAGGAAAYQFVFAGLPENVEYYVAAGPLVSPHYRVRVVDLPAVKGIRVTYQYPKWTGMKPVTEEHSGDLRAIEGTEASIEIETDHPLKNGQLTLDDGHVIYLKNGSGTNYQGTIHMEKDGAYHIAAIEGGQPVRLSEDYFIATEKAMPPEVAINRPGGDYRASPIEEVTVGVKAADQFGLNDVRLHYSVNGGPDRDVNLLKSPGEKSADNSYILRLEDFKLAPGDLVSLYATAKDGHGESRTDITFIQADPFEREFSQSQQNGGGSGGAGGQNNQTDISKREKELIGATWKQQNDRSGTPKDAAAAGQFLSGAQQKLRDQVMALSARMESRDLSEANEEFNGFEKDMQIAAAAMAPSADKLKAMQWKDAIPLEQKALQALLHAEATFRQIQVAFGQQGGGSGSAGRDLASLFDLELDTEKNQYETAQSTSPAEQHEKDVEDALAKLDTLAKRQEDLANQQPNPQQSFQERWQQEMLRREAEQLQRQIEQLAQKNQGQQQNGHQSSDTASSQSGSQQGTSSQSGSQMSRQQAGGQSNAQSSQQRIEQALNRLREANEAMKRSGSPQQSADSAHQAADQLREAANLLGSTQQQLASGKLSSLSHEADRLTQEERTQAERINKLASSQNDSDATDDATSNQIDRDRMMEKLRQRSELAGDRQQLSNDLSKLQKNLRNTAREMAPTQPGVSQKLRDALSEMDQSDLDNHVQRTADWLRGGINPNSNGTEKEIAQGLQKLSQQLHQAQQAMGQAKPNQPGGDEQRDETAMLNQIERLRNQLEAMTDSALGNDQPQGKNGQSGGLQPKGQLGKDAGKQSDQRQQDGLQRDGNRGQQTGNSQSMQSGDIRRAEGGADSAVLGNINTGNNRYGQASKRPVPPDASGNPADNERFYQQGMRELNQLRQMVQSDPQAANEVRELARQMQLLDPRRFPGNPAIVEQMHREVLNSLDRIELQLQRDGSTEARIGKPASVPEGYQDSVAEYYKRLSKNP
ncbi:hypothetical protein [Alloacidobacterium sp.]|uniref:hypothetical protein n=1 Tax=Alloacidobacterium sp. TaxID=2951999 RepID=UPI002D424DE8|nr:hypothetical protein [Alloacidobacterium sp.]HYK36552.1 hypothetical protein [Alloacidobacterium sp.]